MFIEKQKRATEEGGKTRKVSVDVKEHDDLPESDRRILARPLTSKTTGNIFEREARQPILLGSFIPIDRPRVKLMPTKVSAVASRLDTDPVRMEESQAGLIGIKDDKLRLGQAAVNEESGDLAGMSILLL